MNSPSSLLIDNVCFSIGSFKMTDLCLNVSGGEYLVFSGENGAGKSLLMKIICGIYTPDSGRVLLDDVDITGVPPWHRHFGYVPQDGVLFPNRNVRDNIVFGLEVRGADKSIVAKHLSRVSEILGIDHLFARMPQGLSGGERQRVSLARALVVEPKVLLLDEPVSAIDESARDFVCKELKRIQQELGITTIHISHNSRETELVCDRSVLISAGRNIEKS